MLNLKLLLIQLMKSSLKQKSIYETVRGSKSHKKQKVKNVPGKTSGDNLGIQKTEDWQG